MMSTNASNNFTFQLRTLTLTAPLSKFLKNPATPLALATLSALVWGFLYLHTFFDPDIAWLLICLERFLAGGTYTGNFYETNPPLSFLIYLPALPLYAWNIMSAQMAVVVSFFFYIAVANFCTYRLLRILQCSGVTALSFIAALLLTQTWCAAISFGQKDHLVYIFLVPSCLFQVMRTYAHPVKRPLSIACAAMGGLAVCIKPHYAVIPAFLFAHRLWHTKSLRNSVLSIDFVTMLITGVGYALMTYLLFPDFINIMIPEVIDTYLPVETSFSVNNVLPYFILFPASYALSGLWNNRDTDYTIRKYIFYSACALGMSMFIPFLLQGKWFHYQAIPFIASCFFCLLFAAAFADRNKILGVNVILLLATLITFAFGYIQTVGSKKTPVLTPDEFSNLPYHQALLDLAWNGKVLFTEVRPLSTGIFYQLPLTSTSRFAQIWPLTSAISQLQKSPPPSPDEKSVIVEKMNAVVEMLASDIAQAHPSVISIPQYTDPATQKPFQNYRDFLMKNASFAQEMKNYALERSVTLDRSAILPAITEDKDKFQIFDLYVRNKPDKTVRNSGE